MARQHESRILRGRPGRPSGRSPERASGRNSRLKAGRFDAAATAPSAPSFLDGMDWGRLRILAIMLVLGGIWLALWGRAFQLQLLEGPLLAEEARRNHLAADLLTGRRGNILDRNGAVLASSVESRSIFVHPREIADAQGTARFLADTLKISYEQVWKQVSSTRNFVWISRKVDPVLAEAVKAAGRRGVYLSTEFERVYPFQHMAGQLIGFVNVDDVGIEGLELSFEDYLAGRSGRQVLHRDAAGRRFYSGENDNFEDLAGGNLRLTLDSQVQFVAEDALAEGVKEFGARWAGCLVVDVPSGEILAWAEYPFFNPNRVNDFTPFERRNKLAMDALEQGSTIKPFLMAAAMESGIIRPESEFDCENGSWRLHNVTIGDTSPHEILTAHQILQVSSNIGASKIGLELGAELYHSYLTRLGFGDKTGLPLAGESRGILREPGQWTDVDLASASFGQGFAATALQMAQAFLYLAGDGEGKPLRLVLEGPEGLEERPGERLFSRRTMADLRSMLRDAVQGTPSTGTRARIEGVDLGGKTGTAEKAGENGYGEGRVSSFIGFAPLDNPRYLVLVIFDEPVRNSYGSVVAAPVFRNVTTRTMVYHGLLGEQPS